MADRYPLIANSQSGQIQEIQPGDNLNLTENGIVGATTVTATQFRGELVGTSSTALSLQNANNIISGTVPADRLSGFNNVSVSSANALTNADEITGVLFQEQDWMELMMQILQVLLRLPTH